jgi:hypothetical protein
MAVDQATGVDVMVGVGPMVDVICEYMLLILSNQQKSTNRRVPAAEAKW